MVNNPILSIITTSFNTKQITLDCLQSIHQSLEKHPYLQYEIIIVDNNSHDGSAEALQKLSKKENHLIPILNKENLGYGKGNNQAVKQAKGEYLLFINNDTLILDDAITKLLNFYQKNETKMSIVGPKLFNKDMTSQPSCGPLFSLLTSFGFLFLMGDRWGLTRYSPNQIKKVGWVTGACFITTKTIFNDLGGFDEGIFMYMEEVELMYRARDKHYTIYFYPEAHIIHLGSASSAGRGYPVIQAYRGFLYLYIKHHTRFELFLLKCMLKLKSSIAMAIGRLIHNQYLIKTYAEANKLVEMA